MNCRKRSSIFSVKLTFKTLAFFVPMGFLLANNSILAQKTSKIEILNADELGYNKFLRKDISVFKGNCAFRQDNADIFCDSAYFSAKENNFDAFGSVHIIQNGTHIYADKLFYDGQTKMARLYNNIKVIDEDVILTTNYLDYDMSIKLSTFKNGGKLTQKENILIGERGYFYINEDESYFKKNVIGYSKDYILNTDTLRYNTASKIAYLPVGGRLDGPDDCIRAQYGIYDTQQKYVFAQGNTHFENPEQFIDADTLKYYRNTQIANAYSNVTLSDTVQNIEIKGGFAHYNHETEKAYATKNPIAHFYFTENDKPDTLSIAADTLYTLSDTSQKLLKAYRNTKIYKYDFQGVCDSAVYLSKDSVFQCFGNPVLWNNKMQLSARKIELYLQNEALHELKLYSSSLIVEEEGLAGFNQIKGNNMLGTFKENKLSTMLVEGNGQSLYYAREDSGAYIGMNTADCSNIFIRFKAQKAKEITFLTKPDAVFYPMDQLPGQLELPGFKWVPDRRPKTRKELLTPNLEK
jgi:lipopolysaccharide export system protein LptA